MAHYLYQAAFTSDAWATLAKNPQDRTEAVRTLIEGVGGKLISYHFAFGEYDIVVMAELPDNVSAAAGAIAVSLQAGPSRPLRPHPCSAFGRGSRPCARRARQTTARRPSRDVAALTSRR